MKVLAGGLLAACALLVGAMLIAASNGPLSSLEGALFQAVILATGLIGTYIVGRLATDTSARETIKLHARPAFRRIISLYRSLSRLASHIDRLESGAAMNPAERERLETLRALTVEQILTAADAVRDWEDILPGEIEPMLRGNGDDNNGEQGDEHV